MTIPRIKMAKQMLAALGIHRSYIIDATADNLPNDLKEFCYDNRPENGAVFTSEICDLLFEKHLVLQGVWRGRGFAGVFVVPIDQLSRAEFLSLCCHEAAHHFAAFRSKSRDDKNVLRAIRNFWKFDRKTAIESHNAEWARAAVHVWFRAVRNGFGVVDIDHVLQLEQSRLLTVDNCLGTLIDECGARLDDPIESVLRSRPPSAFVAIANKDAKRCGLKMPYRPSQPKAQAAIKTVAPVKTGIDQLLKQSRTKLIAQRRLKQHKRKVRSEKARRSFVSITNRPWMIDARALGVLT